MRLALLVLIAAVTASCKSRSPAPSNDAGISASAPALSGCALLQQIASDACEKRSADAKAHGRCPPRCATALAPRCIEKDDAWMVIVDEEPCPHTIGTERWRLAHAPAAGGAPTYSPVQVREGYPEGPTVKDGAGDIEISFGRCVTSENGCIAAVPDTCVADARMPSLLDCVASHPRRRPSFLRADAGIPEPDAGEEPRTGDWDSGGTGVFGDEEHRRYWIDSLPLVFVGDRDVLTSRLGGPRMFGQLDATGSIVVDGADSIAFIRKECAYLEPLAKALAFQVWHAAVCARLEGKSMAWVADQWRTRCEAPPPPENKLGSDDITLAAICHAAASEKRKGLPAGAARYLESVSALPPPTP